MINRCLFVLLFLGSFPALTGQTSTRLEGEVFKAPGRDINYVGQTPRYYVFESEGSHGNLYQVDKQTMDVLAVMSKVLLEIGSEHAFGVSGDSLVIVGYHQAIGSEAGSKFAFKGFVYALDGTFNHRREKTLFTCEQEKNYATLWFETYTAVPGFYLVCRNDFKFYDVHLNALSLPKDNDPRETHFKSIQRAVAGDTLKKKSFFHLLGGRDPDGNRVYANSTFMPDTFSYFSRGHIEDFTLQRYDSASNLLQSQDIAIRTGSYMLDYGCSFTGDGNILLLGTYQDRMAGNVRIGLFSLLMDRNLKPLTNYVYLPVLDSAENGIEQQQGYELVAHYSYFTNYFMKTFSPGSCYVMQSRAFYNGHYSAMMIEVDRQTGAITPRVCQNNKSGSAYFLNGFLDADMGDTGVVLFFNDHQDNKGLTAFSGDIKTCKADHHAALSFVMYIPGKGFSTRRMLFPYKDEHFLSLSEACISDVSIDGHVEIVAAALSKDKYSCRFVKVVVSF